MLPDDDGGEGGGEEKRCVGRNAPFFLIVLKSQTLMTSDRNVMTVDESGFVLQIPAELVNLSIHYSEEGMARAVSALYSDVENLFPGGYSTEEDG